ncbi:MAG TPA: (Fe-S)-binding protein [Acidimicrobiales bacterium]|nr:(Fe-S)-binding protein [Acidimicrobiales bacterium]
MADHPLLHVADDDLVACVACGLCLPHCPTYRVTGDELASPRGRIAGMRGVQSGVIVADSNFVDAMHSCVQCRGCETACPSGVPFGRLMRGTREALAEGVAGRGGKTPWWLKIGLRALGHPPVLRAGVLTAAIAQRARLPVPGAPARLRLRRPRLASTGGDMMLFTGCVMDQWERDVHVAAVRLLGAVGAGVTVPKPAWAGGCCGALAEHAGEGDLARAQARAVIRRYSGSCPVIVDSAGCGAALANYGELLGTDEADAFAARVVDIHTWLAERADRLPPARRALPGRVAVQDPCHLRHVQRAHLPVRMVLGPYTQIVELDDEGLCCGAGGAYALLHPETANAIRDRKIDSIGRSGAAIVASANPGCALHLANAGMRTVHPVVLAAHAAGLVDDPSLGEP